MKLYLHHLRSRLGLTLLIAVCEQVEGSQQGFRSSKGPAEIFYVDCVGDMLQCRELEAPWRGMADVTKQGRLSRWRNSSGKCLGCWAHGFKAVGVVSTGASWKLLAPAKVQIPDTDILHFIAVEVARCPALTLIWQYSFKLYITFSISNAKGLENLSEFLTGSLAQLHFSWFHLSLLCLLIMSIYRTTVKFGEE